MTQPPAMTEDEFYTKFEPIASPADGSDIWEREEVMALLDADTITENNVWSFVDDGCEGTATVAGWATVNLIGYQVTKVPWSNPLETVNNDPFPSDDEEE